jgi:hypothetical protein
VLDFLLQCRDFSPSCPGLTWASIILHQSLAKKMDRRIKSGDDAVLDDHARRVTVNKPPTTATFINSKPHRRLRASR